MIKISPIKKFLYHRLESGGVRAELEPLIITPQTKLRSWRMFKVLGAMDITIKRGFSIAEGSELILDGEGISIGKNFQVEGTVSVSEHCTIGDNVSIKLPKLIRRWKPEHEEFPAWGGEWEEWGRGKILIEEHAYLGDGVNIKGRGKVIIGNNVRISESVILKCFDELIIEKRVSIGEEAIIDASHCRHFTIKEGISLGKGVRAWTDGFETATINEDVADYCYFIKQLSNKPPGYRDY